MTKVIILHFSSDSRPLRTPAFRPFRDRTNFKYETYVTGTAVAVTSVCYSRKS